MMYVLAVHPTLIQSIILETDLHVLLFGLSSLVASERSPPAPPPLFMLYAPALLQYAM
jgi:hypothetical protein